MGGASKRTRDSAGGVRKRRRMSSASKNSLNMPVHRKQFAFKFATHLAPSGTPTLAQCWQNYRPTLGALPSGQLNEITSFFDMYKINKFKIIIRPRFINFDAGSALTNPVPLITANLDEFNTRAAAGAYDASTFNFFLERGGRGIKYFVGDKQITLVQNNPQIVDSSTGEMRRFGWTSTDNTATTCYGIDVFWNYVNFAVGLTTTEFDIIMELDVSLKGKR